MQILQNSFKQNYLSNKLKVVAFKGNENDKFIVNENLEYGSAVAGSAVGLSALGGIMGAFLGLFSKDLSKEMDHINPARSGMIGAAIGAALSLALLPFTLNSTRERIYQKELQYDILSTIANKSKNGQLSTEEVNDYLKSQALTKMADRPQSSSNDSTLGWMAGSYMVGSSMNKSKKN